MKLLRIKRSLIVKKMAGKYIAESINLSMRVYRGF